MLKALPSHKPTIALGSLVALLLLIFFKTPSSLPVLAQGSCNPPHDYSGCDIAKVGPKIAGNIDIRNYQEIRQLYNQNNPSLINQQIPVTIIFTPGESGDLGWTNYEQTKQNLEAMKSYGLTPIVRIWDAPDETESHLAGEVLDRLLEEVRFSDPMSYVFNEPNLTAEGFHNDPQQFAKSYAAFVQGAGDNPSFKIYMSPLAGHQGGAEHQFAEQVLNYVMSDGRTIAQAIDGAAFTIYNWTPDQFQNDLNQWADLFRSYGVENFIIAELGPLKDGQLLQNITDLNTWVSKMSEIFTKIKNDPSFLLDAAVINTSFFLDTDGDGFPDITALVIINEDGTVTVMYLPYYGGGFGWDQFGFNECKTTGAGSTTFRPYPYESCTLEPDWAVLDLGYATTFLALQKKELHYKAFGECGDDSRTATVSWAGLVTVHMEEPKVPFVGFGDSDNIPQAETKYLADYFDGTLFYDGNPYDATNPEEAKRVFAEGGVFRKLTSQDQQDNLRCLMVQRAKQSSAGVEKNPVHDYTIKLGSESLSLSAFTCPPDKAGTPAYAQWRKNDPSGRLWSAVPVTTRDDYPGQAYLSVQSPPGVLAEPGPHPLSVPHMARLQEITKLVKQTVLSQSSLHSLSSSTNNSPIASLQTSSSQPPAPSSSRLLASSQIPKINQVLASKTSNKLLAEAPPQSPFIINVLPRIISQDGNQYYVGWQVSFAQNTAYPNYSAYDYADFGFHVTINGQSAGGPSIQGGAAFSQNPTYINDYYNQGPISLNLQPGQSIDVSITFTTGTKQCNADNCDSIPWPDGQTFQVTCNVLADGSIDPNCFTGIVPPEPPGPLCRNPNFFNPPNREEDAIEDDINNENLDNMRQTPIETILTVDGYIIRMSTEAWNKWECCAEACDNVPPGTRKECCDQSDCGCCSSTRNFNVSRRIGTDVYLPYMKRTWEQTALLDTSGLFHIFTPATADDFEEKWAKDEISFDFSPPGWTEPSSGWLYFPYLGGTQLAKECIINQILCSEGYDCPDVTCPPFQ